MTAPRSSSALLRALALLLTLTVTYAAAASVTPQASRDLSSSRPVKVSLAWSDPVDLDLEIWDVDSMSLLERAFNRCGRDVTDGSAAEWFLFKQYPDRDYSTGVYIVSVYYAARPEDSNVDEVEFTLTIRRSDGSTEERHKVVYWEAGQDQILAFAIMADTGEIMDIDYYISTVSDDGD